MKDLTGIWMAKKFMESEEQKVLRQRSQVVKQLEGARREISLVKRFLDAPSEDPYWEQWTDQQRGELMLINRDATALQLRIRELTLQFQEKVRGSVEG